MAKRHKDLRIPEHTKPEYPFIQILDPATGTGTFLVEVISLIHKSMTEKWQAEGHDAKRIEQLWNEYVPSQLLTRLYGYELLMAPYAIAHMKIGLKLYETGYRFGSDEHARVYLTNSLDPPQDFSRTLAFAIPALAHEAEAVNAIKRNQRFTVVIGNPPYSVYSANKTKFIDLLMKKYKQIKGEPVEEVRIAPLMDDYCKFLRYSDHLIEQSGKGVIGMITNHSYLSGPVFRGMRFNLESRYLVEVLDLHGNYFRDDPSRGDINVFEIKPGVCISIFTKFPGGEDDRYVHYDEMRGTDEHKLQRLLNYGRLRGATIKSVEPFYYFTPQSSEGEEYLSFHAVNDIFEVGTLGMMTGKDHFMIAHTAKDMKSRINELCDTHIPDSDLRRKYQLVDSRDWVLKKARQIVFDKSCLEEVCYRPFDRRFTYYDKKALASPQSRVNEPLRQDGNIALCVPRQLASLPFRHALVSNCVTEMSFISNRTKEANRVFALYKSNEAEHLSLLRQPRRLNLQPLFLTSLSRALGLQSHATNRLPDGITAEYLFGYIYAILYSEEYRTRYAEFLRKDFPRLPLTASQDLFHALAELGGDLVALHLMESRKLNDHTTTIIGTGEFRVEKVSYADETVWINKAKTRGFQGVPEEVWNFYIGGYQVCEKWLKDRGPQKGRPGRVLTNEDIIHYQKIVVALKETIRIMKEIDKVIEEHGGLPDAFVINHETPMIKDSSPF